MSMSDSDTSSQGGEYKNLRQISRESKFLNLMVFNLVEVWLIRGLRMMFYLYKVGDRILTDLLIQQRLILLSNVKCDFVRFLFVLSHSLSICLFNL